MLSGTVRAFTFGLVALFVALAIGPPSLAQPVGAGSPGGLSPAACSGHGQRNMDRCFCDSRWTGPECATPEAPPNCGAHGAASNGRCVCQPGWKGHACQTALPVCAHGKLAHDKCACEAGWSGELCDKGP